MINLLTETIAIDQGYIFYSIDQPNLGSLYAISIFREEGIIGASLQSVLNELVEGSLDKFCQF
jgi:hypothetical protein